MHMFLATEVLIFVTLVAVVMFVPPSNLWLILCVNTLLGIFIYLLLSPLLKKKFRLLLALLILFITTLKAFQLLDFLNFLLTISLFVGLAILVK